MTSATVRPCLSVSRGWIVTTWPNASSGAASLARLPGVLARFGGVDAEQADLDLGPVGLEHGEGVAVTDADDLGGVVDGVATQRGGEEDQEQECDGASHETRIGRPGWCTTLLLVPPNRRQGVLATRPPLSPVACRTDRENRPTARSR